MKHWTQFWKASRSLSSFAEGKSSQGYADEVKAYWENIAKDLPKDAVIVDVGTGNGALAVLLNDLKKEKKTNWTIHGVDAAEVFPQELEKAVPEFKGRFDGVQFHGETSMTKMPFDDNSVDLIVSQFAFEYADEKEALAEALRVLKPSGRLAMLAHHKKSNVHKSTETGVEVIDYIVGKTPLFIQADLFLRFASQGLTQMDKQQFESTQEAQATGKTTEWIAEQIREKFKKEEQDVWVTDILRRVFTLMGAADSAEKAKQAGRELSGHYDLLLGHQFRLKDMLESAKTESQVKKLITAAKKSGAEGDYESFNVEDETFAWAVSLQKS
ncbi:MULTISPECIES: class I SAM-dependent methyltransferase [Gammaproteobacteria]|uniref:class I SAM-dependent methyltransferase n=1 Tax=Gammaproteobacteria TaxID=1236 RepID=UPI000DD0CB92|nr:MULTISPECIES: class I SAM-dependent methyltransferase [Gammaproteobacteria]RTE85912.1 class I SAM-dependent methyltransferase [Aliidiomarina sp. B3213]TCZ90089.1 class I SAM-dependent methyltransferase [Lysobacter sp. N42]